MCAMLKHEAVANGTLVSQFYASHFGSHSSVLCRSLDYYRLQAGGFFL